MRTPLKVALFLGLALVATQASTGAVQKQAGHGQESGLMLMRQVLTIQANKPFAKAGYGSLSDVLKMMPMTRGVAPDAAQAVQVSDAETADGVANAGRRAHRCHDNGAIGANELL